MPGNKVDNAGVCGPKNNKNELKEAKLLCRAEGKCTGGKNGL